MSIEAINITANNTRVEPEEIVETAVTHPRVTLHDEAVEIIKTLHELQARHTKLTLGLIALAEQMSNAPTDTLTYTRDTMADEHRELAGTINALRKQQRENIVDITTCNQTITRPLDTGSDADKAERKRLEQPYIIQIYNNGEDPTQTTGLPDHSVGVNYRYLSNAPL